MTGAELFVDCLKAQGVEWVSALCGNGLNDILVACHEAEIRIIDVRNEQTASYMAESWGRLSGQVGVCLVSSGVAHANAMTGVVNASFDGAPMLLVTGAGPGRTTGLGHFQDLDHVSLARPVCKYAEVMTMPERIPEYVHGAFAAALNGRPGPVHLSFPMDVQATAVQAPRVPPRVCRAAGSTPAPDQVQQAVDMLFLAQRPLLVVGSGAYYSGAQDVLTAFAAAHAIPVMVPIWDRGAVPVAFPEFMGVVGAATGDPPLLEEADLVMLVGAEQDYRSGYASDVPMAARVIRIDNDPTRLYRAAADLDLVADPAAAVQAMNEVAVTRGLCSFDAWLERAQQLRDDFCGRIRQQAERRHGLHALDILDVIETTVADDAVLVVDGGNIGQWFHQTLGRRRYPGHWLTCGASGVVGFGIGGAMAASAGLPQRSVVLLSGDGSATFTLTDLERAVNQGLPFVMIVADDERWGIVDSGQLDRYGKAFHSALGGIDFVALAQSLGAMGVHVETADELGRALVAALQEQRPVLLHVPICGGMPHA